MGKEQLAMTRALVAMTGARILVLIVEDSGERQCVHTDIWEERVGPDHTKTELCIADEFK